MKKIYLITFRDKDVFGGTLMVSHGVYEDTLQSVVLSQDPLSYYITELHAKRDDSGEYYITYDENKAEEGCQ